MYEHAQYFILYRFQTARRWSEVRYVEGFVLCSGKQSAQSVELHLQQSIV